MTQVEKQFNLNLSESDKNAQDLVNNNHISISALEEKAKYLSLLNSQYVFDSHILSKLKSSDFLFKYDKFEVISNEKTRECSVDLGDNLFLRPLKRDDFSRGYMKLLSQLTETGNVTQEDFERRFDQMRATPNTYFILVIEDSNQNKTVASLTLVYEQKFIRQTSARGRIEDVVVDSDFRGKRLSKILLDVACQLGGPILGCYKISLECKDQLKSHYGQFKFLCEQGQNYLCRRYV